MRAEGLQGLCSRRFVPRTTQSDPDQPIAPNRLAERPAPTKPNQTWVTDLTSVWTAEGWLYGTVLLDWGSRRVVGWATADTLHTRLATQAVQMAVQHRQPPQGVRHHSDRGVPYASGE